MAVSAFLAASLDLCKAAAAMDSAASYHRAMYVYTDVYVYVYVYVVYVYVALPLSLFSVVCVLVAH